MKKNNKVIYTIITSDYDYLRKPRHICDDYDYICFTDQRIKNPGVWKIKRIRNEKGIDLHKLQRHIKICPHLYLQDYCFSVYVDGNIRIIGDLSEYIGKYMKSSDMLCVTHPDRHDVYMEAEECIRLNKDTSEKIQKQIKRYKEEGFPKDSGLIVSSVLARNHMNQKVINVMNAWWNEVRNESVRDQLSFGYVCWKNQFNYDLSPISVYKNDYWVCSGIHTKDIEVVEDYLIDAMLLSAYRGWYITKLEKELEVLNHERLD